MKLKLALALIAGTLLAGCATDPAQQQSIAERSRDAKFYRAASGVQVVNVEAFEEMRRNGYLRK